MSLLLFFVHEKKVVTFGSNRKRIAMTAKKSQWCLIGWRHEKHYFILRGKIKC